MDLSIFKVIGPIMIGPSSSHTAGAAKLSRVARMIINKPFDHVSFGLHGSFAKTYKGHGTDKALVAGVLGLFEDDERIVNAFDLAHEQGVGYDFYEIHLEEAHENSVKITFSLDGSETGEVIGSSLGGGLIMINSINGFETEVTAQLTTLVLSQKDKPGIISRVSGILAENGINIGTMKVSRQGRGESACCIIETDSPVTQEALRQIENVKHVNSVQLIPV